jgi:hypothetical protein
MGSPYNHNTKAAAAEPHLRPVVSQKTINQIANQMDNAKPIPKSQNELCQGMLSGMPEIGSFGQPEPAQNAYLDGSGNISDTNKELNKLLNVGYRPLEKNGGKWSEKETTQSSDHNKLLLE